MKLGFREGVLYDEARPDWDAAGPRPISWSLWYPAADDARENEIAERSWFQKAAAARDAPIRPAAERPTPWSSCRMAPADLRPDWSGWRDAWSIADFQHSASAITAIPASSPIALKALPVFGSGRRI